MKIPSAWQNIFVYLVFALSITTAQALTITPAPAEMQANEELNFSVVDSVGTVIWAASSGQILGGGTQITYKAPPEPRLVWLVVVDENAYLTHPIDITAPLSSLDAGKASWETFSNRSSLLSILHDGEKLWVGTSGGLELRARSSGRLIRLYNNLDGFPSIWIQALLSIHRATQEGQAPPLNNGLWIGLDKGLVQLKEDGNIMHHKLLDETPAVVQVLAADGTGGLLIGNLSCYL